MSSFTRHDKEMLEIMRDPVKWVAHHLGEIPRWYQEQILRHPHHRKVLRCGRRIGKCIEETQRVLNPETGEYKTVSQLYNEQNSQEESAKLITLNEKYHLEESEAFFVEDNGVKPTFKVTTKYGAEVKLTGNHPVLTLDGWLEVDALEKGMRIATPSAMPYFGKSSTNDDKVKTIAYLIAGGHWSGKQLTFSCKSQEVANDFVESAHNTGIRVVKQVTKENTYVVASELDDELMKAIEDKRVPDKIFTSKREKMSLFLNRLYAASGWGYNGSRPEIGYATVSHNLAIDIKHLLLRFGIQSNLQTKKKEYKGRLTKNYQLMIHRREGLLMFGSDIGIYDKEQLILDIVDKTSAIEAIEQTVPKEVWNYIEEERNEKKLSKADVAGSKEERLRTNQSPTVSKITKYADNLESAFLYDLARSDVIWEEVTDIEEVGERRTFDVFVPETHNLVVEDVMVHNTWTMAAHMLWVAFTCNGGTELKKGATCVVATPYDNQARLIYDQLKAFIDDNPVLENSISSMTKNPYVIQFKNKSIIRLFTAGTRSGSEGGSLRGQKASWLYMDEVDYMSDKDFEAIYAITLEAPLRIGVMVASTPTGRRGMFHKICTETKLDQEVDRNDDNYYNSKQYDRKTASGWKEFYYPTMVNPEWDSNMEKELRGMYSEVAYEHEVLAEFGTEMVGVFNKAYTDEASDIPYALLNRPQHDGPITIGIDWDKYGAATQIVVTQFDQTENRRSRPEVDGPGVEKIGRFKVINRIEIPKGDFTYDLAVQKIIELDKIYSPRFIYPDRGAGEYQIEMLRKHLGEKVKGIHLGGSHMVRDPSSREFDKKPIKPFMVNQATLILERGMLRIPHKEIDETINRQMTNYQVERVSTKTGEPTYSSDDEHALDAMMLSLLAFIIEMPDIAQTIEDVQAARNFGHAAVKFVDPLSNINQGFSDRNQGDYESYKEKWDEPTPPPPRKTSVSNRKRSNGFSWGGRGSKSKGAPSRRSW
jgi:intein/homing endonuclease